MTNPKETDSLFGLGYTVLAVLVVLLAPLPLASLLTYDMSDFEGGRGYAIYSFAPFIGIALAVSPLVMFFVVRNSPQRHTAILITLACFNALACLGLLLCDL